MIEPLMGKLLAKYISPILWRCGKDSRRYEIYEYMQKAQWNSLEKNKKIQREKLFNLVEYTIGNIAYYKKIADARNIKISKETILKDIKKFPILTKEIIRKEFENLYDHLGKDRLITNTTGGTTGQPIEFFQNKNFKDYAAANKMLFANWCGLENGDLTIMLWGSERDILERKKSINDFLFEKFMNNIILNSFDMSEKRMKIYADLIAEKNPKLIIAYVQSITELSRYIIANEYKFKRPINVMTSAGTLYGFQRNIIKQAFGGEVFNKYGSREVSDLACECEKHEGLHLNIFTHYMEILDKNLNEVKKEGEVGDIYVTSLENCAMPFIRYKIGDQSQVTNKICSCGRGLPLIKHIVGRHIEALRNSKGKFIPAEFFIHFIGVVFNKGFIDRFQVIQKSPSEIDVRVVIKNKEQFKKAVPEIEKSIKKVFEDGNLIINWLYEKEINSDASGKYRYVISSSS